MYYNSARGNADIGAVCLGIPKYSTQIPCNVAGGHERTIFTCQVEKGEAKDYFGLGFK